MSFFSNLWKQVKRLFKRDVPSTAPTTDASHVVQVPVTPAPVVSPTVETSTPPATVASPSANGGKPAETLIQAAQRLQVSPNLYGALMLEAQYEPEGLTAEQLVTIILAKWANQQVFKPQKGVEQDGRGTFPVKKLKWGDLGYLHYKSGPYTQVKQNGDIWRDVLSGTHAEINAAIGSADVINVGRAPFPFETDALAQAVEAAFQAAQGN